MPELPDLAILADALDTALSGRPFAGGTTPQSLVLRGTPAELGAFEGQALLEVVRRGKFLVFRFERDRLVFNPMLTGRLGLAPAGAKAWPRAAALFTRMGKIYLLPAGVTRPVAGWDEQGPDADDPALTLDVWRERIGRHSGELKNLLRNQQFVAGIGNAYSDEILWAAGLAPFRKRASLAATEIDALYRAMRSVLAWAIAELQRRVPPRLEVEQRDFLRVHRKGNVPCPRCGTRLSEVSAGGFVTSFCRGCQR